MKKVLAVLMVLSILFAFAGCKNDKQYNDKLVTEIVTDEYGEEVTDENGNIVTQVVDVPAQDENTTADNSETEAGNNATAPSGTTKKSDKKKTTEKKTNKSEKTTAKKTTEKKTTEATTKKPKKRPVTVVVNYPYFNSKKTTVTIAYKLEGDKKYTRLDPEEIVMDKAQTITYDLGKLKGDVKVVVNIKDVSVTPGTNKGTIPANEDTITFDISTGIEVINVFE